MHFEYFQKAFTQPPTQLANECGDTLRNPGPEVIKLFSSSAQLSMKFQLLINAKIVKISGKYRFIPQNLVIYPANKC